MDLLKTGAGDPEFPVTDWGRLLRIQDPANPDFARTLDRLASEYWSPVFHYVRALRRTASIDDAKDLTQQFFTILLDRGDLGRLSPDRGSFRGFLKTALRNFLASDSRARATRRPRDGARLFPIDPARDESEAAPDANPEEAFDREWARVVLDAAVDSLEQVLASEGKRVYFEVFRDYCLDPSDSARTLVLGEPEAAPTYAELAARYGVKETDVGNYLRYCKKRMREILRARVRAYLDEGVDVDEELAFLLAGS